MRIGIDVSFLNDLNCGSGQYIYHLIWALNRIDKQNQYVLFSRFENNLDFNLNCNFKWKRIKTNYFGRRVNKLLWETLILPRVVNKSNIDMIFVPYFSSSIFKKKSVMSILDTIQFRIKDYNGKIKNKIYQLLIKRAAKTYSKIITISFTEKKKISHDLNLLVDKIKVIYLAQNINSRIIRDKKAIERIKNKYGIGNCFIFYVGGFDKRKNIDRLILAFEKLPIKYQLILAGNPSKYHLTKKLDKRIKFIGFVEQNDLPFLYNSAKLFVYPSVDEGFGIPPLDAMACGTPVITSKTEESKEIYGNSVIYFDPLSIESIEKSIRNATNDKKLLRKIRKKGLNMSKKFNWIKSAKKHLKILIEVNKNIK